MAGTTVPWCQIVKDFAGDTTDTTITMVVVSKIITNIPGSSFFTSQMYFCRPTNSAKVLKAMIHKHSGT